MGDRLWRVVGGSRPPEPSSAGVLPNILLNQTRYCIKHYENHLPERLALHIATRMKISQRLLFCLCMFFLLLSEAYFGSLFFNRRSMSEITPY